MTTSTTTLPPPPLTRDALGTLVGQTMGLVAGTAAMFAVGAYLGRDLSAGWALVLLLVSFGLLIAIGRVAPRSMDLAVALLHGFGFLTGLALAPTLAYYAKADPDVVWLAGGATALFIAGFGAAGYATRRDLSVYARTLFWALVGLLAFGVVLLIVQIPGGSLIYAVLGLVIFAGWTAIDFQRLRVNQDATSAPLIAVSIFLDILNVFLLMLSLFKD